MKDYGSGTLNYKVVYSKSPVFISQTSSFPVPSVKTDFVVYLYCFIDFVTNSSVTCSPSLPLTRNFLLFVYSNRSVNRVE